MIKQWPLWWGRCNKKRDRQVKLVWTIAPTGRQFLLTTHPRKQLTCQPTGMVSDDEESTGSVEDILEDEDDWPNELNKVPHEFNLDGPTTPPSNLPNNVVDEKEWLPTPAAECLQYHHNFGHLPFPKLQQMARMECYHGALPHAKYLCVQHANMHKQPSIQGATTQD